LGRALNRPTGVHDQVARRLRAEELRYTPGRRAIVDVLDTAERPLTVPEILERSGPRSVPLSSAYRNLTALVEAGVARRVAGTDDHGRYELAEELAGHHHHLLCDSCGVVTDISASPRLERALAEAGRTAREEVGFEVTSHRIDLLGRCRACSG
jgi:Fur family transcriptional regulator, ferric uptake regulator